MIDIVPIFKIAPIFAAALISPGPDFMLVSSLAMSRGRITGIQAACGISFGLMIYAGLCVFGLGLIFEQIKGLMIAVRLCGGAYLVYLGYQLWKSSFKPHMEDVPTVTKNRRRNPFVVGLITTMTNPKTIAFFASIFALTMPTDASQATKGFIIIVMGMMPVFWFSLVSLCLSAPQMRKTYQRWSRWIDRVCGSFLAFFGVRLLSSLRN